MHFLTATDLTDQDFAMATNKGYGHFKAIFQTINTSMGYGQIDEVNLTFAKLNTENVKNSIAKFDIKPNDIIVFYYSGKVYYPPTSNSEYPHLILNDTKTKPMSFDEVANLIKAQGARLAIAIADGRNTKLKLETPQKPPDRDTEVAFNNRIEIIKHLMNTTCGLVKIASNNKNKPAYAVTNRSQIFALPNSSEYKIISDPNEYSLFSVSFMEVFDRILQKARALYKFNGLLRGVDYRMNKELNPTPTTNREQELKWEIQSCEKNTSTDKIFANLEDDLNDLLEIKNPIARQNFITTIIDKYATLKTEYHVLRNISANAATTKTLSINTKLSSYLNKSLKAYNPKIMSIVIIKTPKPGDEIVITELEEFYSE